MSEKDEKIVLREGDEKLEVSMGFVARGSVGDFHKIREFIEKQTTTRLVRGTMSSSHLWLVKNHEYEVLRAVEKRNSEVKSK